MYASNNNDDKNNSSNNSNRTQNLGNLESKLGRLGSSRIQIRLRLRLQLPEKSATQLQ